MNSCVHFVLKDHAIVFLLVVIKNAQTSDTNSPLHVTNANTNTISLQNPARKHFALGGPSVWQALMVVPSASVRPTASRRSTLSVELMERPTLITVNFVWHLAKLALTPGLNTLGNVVSVILTSKNPACFAYFACNSLDETIKKIFACRTRPCKLSAALIASCIQIIDSAGPNCRLN